MPNEIGYTDKRNQQELSELHRQHREKRSEIVNNHESQLQQLKKEQQKKEQQLHKQHEAHVNHIQNNYESQISSQKESYDKKIAYDRKLLSQKHLQTKESGTTRLEDLKTQISSKELEAKNRIKKISQTEEQKRSAEKQRTAELIKLENSKRLQEERQLRDEINNVQSQLSKKHQNTKMEMEQKHNSLQQTYLSKEKKIADENKQKIEYLRNEKNQSLKELHNQRQKITEQTIKSQNQDLNEIQNRGRETLLQEKARREFELKNQKQLSQDQLRNEIQKNTNTKQKVRSQYDQEIQELHKKGEYEVNFQKSNFLQKKQLAEESHKQQLEEQKIQQNNQTKRQQELHNEKIISHQKTYDKLMLEQKKEFDSAYNKNSIQQKESLTNQKRILMDALKKQRLSSMKKFGQYSQTSSDPFYQHKDLDMKIQNLPNSFIVNLKVPEHERENIRFRIKDQQVVIEGARSFKERLDSGDGKRTVSSNSYETFRESVILDEPVLAKAARSSFSNGTLEIIIPKKIKT